LLSEGHAGKDGKVAVTCKFWNSMYEFTPEEAGVEQG
jgi:redox-regulated HSP33 family molecular chaperone